MGNDEVKVTELLVSPKTVATMVVGVIVAYGWMFTTFVSAADFNKHIENFNTHTQTYELDRTDDKIDDLEFQIFSLEETIRTSGESTPEQRKQLSKYQGDMTDYRRQQECLEDGRSNCRRKR